MRPRERVLKTLNHEEPDRVPLDEAYPLEYQASLTPDIWPKIRYYFGVDEYETLRQKLGIDLRTVTMDPPEGWTPIKYPDGSEEDEWGIRRKPGATGEHWHFAYHPLEHMPLEDYLFPDLDAPGRLHGAEKTIRTLQNEHVISAIMECTLFETAWYLRGFRLFLKDLYTNPAFVNRLLDRLLKNRIEMGRRFIELGVDVIRLGDDVGMQTGMLLPVNLWRSYFKPRMASLIKDLKKHGNVHIFYHSDGNIELIIPELIEIGVDILNPVQPDCMDPARIKEVYGEKMTLHGTISIQETLPFGTREDVRNEVLTRIRTCAYSGGLIIAPGHVIEPGTPVENVIALYENARKLGQYSAKG